MINSISYSRPKWDLWMAAAHVCVAVVLGVYPADRAVWCVEMVWAVGLWAILLLTRRKFRFSTPAYLCFFVWTVLCDTLGALCASTLFLCSMKKRGKER